MQRFISLLVSICAASGAAFAAFSVLQLFEQPIQSSLIDIESQAPRPVVRGVFGLPWESLATPLIYLSAVLGFFCAMRASTSSSLRWRLHIPFFFGLTFLGSALFLAVTAARSQYGETLLHPVPMEIATLTLFGLTILIPACHQDDPSPAPRFRRALRAFRSSQRSHFHFLFFLGLAFLTAAFLVVTEAIRSPGVWSDDSAQILPAPIQAIMLTTCGLIALLLACLRDR